nr:hypothetical protein [Tanacetum cinerariifolium]
MSPRMLIPFRGHFLVRERMLLRAVGIARLRFRYLSVLPSPSAVTYSSVTFLSIGRNGFVFLYPNCRSYKVRIGKRQRDEDEPKLLETIIRRVVLLLPVAPDRFSGELKASVEKLFDEGGSGKQAKQGDSASGGRGVVTQLVDVVAETVVEDVAPVQLKRQKKRKTKVGDVGEPSHPAKKLRDDYGAPGGPTVSEREGGDHAELLVGANLHTIGAPQRTSMPIITSATTTTPTIDHATIAKEKLVGSSVFGVDSLSAGRSHPSPGGFSYCTSSDFLIGGIHIVIDPDFNLQKGYHKQLFTEFNVGAARQMSLSVKVRISAKYNIRERKRLNSIVDEKDALLKAKDEEIRSLKAQLVLKEAEATEAIRLHAEASNFEAIEKSLQSEMAALKERNNLLKTEKNGLDVKVADLAASVKVREQEVADLDVVVTSVKLQNDNLVDQDDRMREMNGKFNKLDTDLVEMALHLEERFYPHLLTTIFRRRWLLTYSLELAIAKCLNSTEYLSTLEAAIGKAVEKGMQDGLSAKITHGAEELKSNKDASFDTIMNLLRSKDSLAKKLGLTKSQPHVDHLMVPIHHSLDQRVVGASALSLSLDVSSSRVWRIKENIAKHRSALCDVFVPLSEPLFVMALTRTKSTLNVIPATIDTTTTLSVTPVSASPIPPISTDDYEVAHVEDGDSAGADVNPFLNVDSAKLNIPQ